MEVQKQSLDPGQIQKYTVKVYEQRGSSKASPKTKMIS